MEKVELAGTGTVTGTAQIADPGTGTAGITGTTGIEILKFDHNLTISTAKA